MLIDVVANSGQLKALWFDVFDDEQEYISLLFDKGYTPAECFGAIVDGKIVSALYLLSCSIRIKGTQLRGRYLYAAATLDEYRGRGLMAQLIYEAEKYVSDNGLDFISLVPATEKLYDYYAKFGFKTLMYKYVSEYEGTNADYNDEIISVEDALEIRKKIQVDNFSFSYEEMKYAYMCLEYYGYKFYRNSFDSYYIADNNKGEIIEYLSSEENFRANTEQFLCSTGKAVINSPYDLSFCCRSIKTKFGMVYFTDEKSEMNSTEGIYMNIALD